jgi:hypothetical protein
MIVVPYNEEWPLQFETIRNILAGQVSKAIRIEGERI